MSHAWTAISSGSASPTSPYSPIRCGSPPKARYGAAIKAHGFLCPTPSSSAMMPDSSTLDVMRCAGSMPSGWSTSSTPSPTAPQAQQHVRALIWWFYRDLKAYKREPSSRRKAEMRARFDRIFKRRTGFATLDRLLARLHANKAELLMVLDRPRDPAAHQRLGERHPLPGDQAQDQRRYAQRSRARLPRCLSRPRQDLRQARHRLLGLSRRQARNPKSARRPPPPSPRRASLRVRLTARTFAPVTSSPPPRAAGAAKSHHPPAS